MMKDGQFEISGLVKTGADERERCTRRAAPYASTQAAAPGATSKRCGSPVTCVMTTAKFIQPGDFIPEGDDESTLIGTEAPRLNAWTARAGH
ncbi:hypothetical protein [Streptomyces sp. NPDC003483]